MSAHHYMKSIESEEVCYCTNPKIVFIFNFDYYNKVIISFHYFDCEVSEKIYEYQDCLIAKFTNFKLKNIAA